MSQLPAFDIKMLRMAHELTTVFEGKSRHQSLCARRRHSGTGGHPFGAGCYYNDVPGIGGENPGIPYDNAMGHLSEEQIISVIGQFVTDH